MNQEAVIEQLCELSKADDNVRVLVLNGSLVNPNVEADAYQDVDVTCFVRDVSIFLQDRSWIRRFGKVLIMQTPDEVPGRLVYDRFAFLVQYEDGHRIDLTVRPLHEVGDAIAEDSLSLVLLDRDGLAGTPVPTDESYWIRRPTRWAYDQCWNEFWWVSLYVVKGLRRGQMLYALDHLGIMRTMLRQMLMWDVGFATDFSVNVGKAGDRLKDYVSTDDWAGYLQTYTIPDPSALERAFEAAVRQFQDVSRRVAHQARFPDKHEQADQIRDGFSTLWQSND
ncbi:aminoglycoside 6-adenylyltransferase [Exiguobacterium sp.]|uniref:aminoglycoside 6-adenylyltransferase n=1 Tax=Exiguobacterium sp. TaxID=44751 RepID=UPI00263A55B0|nr:aminoglycoside 6-adenylyltransferase [Exiguobacterium sp.]MCC5893389.1 aminoglycoside 6-adenylyltransferase [Exiguobacterium sp.]